MRRNRWEEGSILVIFDRIYAASVLLRAQEFIRGEYIPVRRTCENDGS